MFGNICDTDDLGQAGRAEFWLETGSAEFRVEAGRQAGLGSGWRQADRQGRVCGGRQTGRAGFRVNSFELHGQQACPHPHPNTWGLIQTPGVHTITPVIGR